MSGGGSGTRSTLATFLGIASLAGVMAGSPAAVATSFPALEERGLVATSTLVVRARIASKTAERLGGPERRQKIATLYTVAVVEVLRGALSAAEARESALTVGLPGGIIGDIGQRVSGVPELEVGEEYVLFLGPDSGPGGARGVVGHALGTYRVTARGHLVPHREYGGHPSVPRRLDLLRAMLGVNGGPLPGDLPNPNLPHPGLPEPGAQAPAATPGAG